MAGKLDTAALDLLHAPEPLQWLPGDAWHIRSACGRYTVFKALICGAKTYTAWRIQPGGPASSLGMDATADAAKARAARDAQRNEVTA